MQVIIHAGVHRTNEDVLLKALRRNAGTLRAKGVAVPGPGKYRQLIFDVLQSMTGISINPGSRDVLIDEILDGDETGTDRLILSHPNLFSVPKLIFGDGRYYRNAESRMRNICDLFEGDEVELFLGLRDPATFLYEVYTSTPHSNFADFMNGVDPMQLRWSDLLERIQDAVPNMKITLWCNEDAPLIWPEVIARTAGLPADTDLDGAYDIFASIIDKTGMTQFLAFLKEHPDLSQSQKRRIMLSFLDRFAVDEAIEQTIDLPGWDDAYIRRLSQIYDDDMVHIARMPNVTFINP